MLWDNFEVIAEAENGIQRLRELILDLAIRGKLVAQSAEEGNSDDLLNFLPELRAKKISEGLFKQTRHPRGIKVENPPHDIPKNWCWRHLGDIGEIIGGGTPKSSEPKYWSDQEDIPWITPADMTKQESRYIVRGKRDITQEGLKKSSAQLMPAGTVLFSSRAPIGHVGIAANPISTNQGFKSCSPYHDEMSEYIFLYLRYVGKKVNEQATGTTFKEVSGKDVALIPIPVPPLPEQKRIVKKVDELMKLCDRAEASKKNRNELQQQLRRSAIHALETAETEEDFKKSWHFVRDNFSAIVTQSNDIKDFRELVLDLALRGKLTFQNSRNEPVDKLLARIALEKQKLIQSGKIKKGSEINNIDASYLPPLPNGWKYCNLQDLTLFGPRNGYSPKAVEYPTSVCLITLTAVTSGQFDGNYYKYVDEDIETNSHLWLQPGDLLIQRSNTLAYVGSCAIYDQAPKKYIYPDLIMRVRVSEEVDLRYIYFVISSNASKKYFQANASGTSSTMPKINQKVVNSLPIPLPPLEEQKRIVNKVDELMKICDRAEESLRKKEELASAISASIIHHLKL